MCDDFCLTHGYEYMKKATFELVARCTACEAEQEAAMEEHKLKDNTLKRDCQRDGIAVHCSCGWSSGSHFTTMSASAAFQDHKETCAEGKRS